MPSKPTFVFIPGAWHTPAYFASTMAKLAEQGYESKAVTTPSVGTEPAVESLEPDISAITSVLESLLDSGEDVIVVAHSYGGTCGTAAVGALAKRRQGLQHAGGAIRRVVYVAAILPLEGESQGAALTAVPVNPYGETNFYRIEGPWVVLNEHAAQALYHDAPEAACSGWKQMTKKHSLASLLAPVTTAAWKYIPTTHIYTSLDRVFYLTSQKWLVQRIRDAGVQSFGATAFSGELGEFTLECGHTPFLSNMEQLVEILVTVAQG